MTGNLSTGRQTQTELTETHVNLTLIVVQVLCALKLVVSTEHACGGKTHDFLLNCVLVFR